jgi:hypothetical protein
MVTFPFNVVRPTYFCVFSEGTGNVRFYECYQRSRFALNMQFPMNLAIRSVLQNSRC